MIGFVMNVAKFKTSTKSPVVNAREQFQFSVFEINQFVAEFTRNKTQICFKSDCTLLTIQKVLYLRHHVMNITYMYLPNQLILTI